MIRRANLADLENISKLCITSATAAHWPIEVYASVLRGEGPVRLCLVAQDAAGILTGVLVALCQTEEWELENIVVAHDQQRKGIGREMMCRFIAEAMAHHASAILLEVRASNSAAQRFYQSCGFKIAATRKSYYSNPLEDALVMTRKFGKSALEIS